MNLFEKKGTGGLCIHYLRYVLKKNMKHLSKISRNFLGSNIFSIDLRSERERERRGKNKNKSLTEY